LTRFNYWAYAIINPLFAANEEQVASLVHPDISSRYQGRFDAGEHEAIFEYAAQDPLALQAPWVGQEVTSWRLQGGTANRKKFQKFVRAYWTERGRRKPATLIEDIERDQEVYKAIMNRQPAGGPSLAAWMNNVSREKVMGLESVREIYKEYCAEMHYRLGTMKRTPEEGKLLDEIRQEVSRRRRKEMEPRDPKKWLKDLPEFYLYLDQCLENLKRYCRGERPIRLELESPPTESLEGKRRPRTLLRPNRG
jgi:hypothetical protein